MNLRNNIWFFTSLESERCKVTVTDAKANLADLIQRAEAGEEVVLTENGKSVVKLVAISKTIN